MINGGFDLSPNIIQIPHGTEFALNGRVFKWDIKNDKIVLIEQVVVRNIKINVGFK